MIFIILGCLVLCLIGFLLNKEIAWIEFIGLCLIVILVAVISWCIATAPIPNDVHYISGRINYTAHYPAFTEKYKQRHEKEYPCGKDDDGYTKYCTKVWYTTEYARHYESYEASDTLGQEVEITQKFYHILGHDFGNNEKRYDGGSTYRCTHGGHAVSGDNGKFYFKNETNTYNFPTTRMVAWYNPLKHKWSLFNTEKESYPYPERYNWIENDRTTVKDLRKSFDIMNTRLYERHGVNVILTSSKDDLIHDWNKGKKNDIVIQVDNIAKPSTVKVFGWYKSERLSTELETLILEKGISKDTLPLIQHKISSYYEPFDFNQFNYLRYQLDGWELILITVLTIIFGIGFYILFSQNDLER